MPSAEAASSTTKATRGRVGAGHVHTCWAGSQGASPATARRQRRGGRVLSPDLRENTGKHKPRATQVQGVRDPDAVTGSPTGCHTAVWKSVALLFVFKDQTLVLENRFPALEADLFSRREQTAQLPGRGVLPAKQSGLAPRLQFLPGALRFPCPQPREVSGTGRSRASSLPHCGLGVGGMNPHLHRRL